MKIFVCVMIALAICAMVVGALGIGLMIMISKPGDARVLLSNESGERIEVLELSVADEAFRILDLPSGSSAGIDFPVRRTSEYQVRVKLASGKEMKSGKFYVTRNMKFRHRHVISGTDVSLDYKYVAKGEQKPNE
jgi:hypothetical protein